MELVDKKVLKTITQKMYKVTPSKKKNELELFCFIFVEVIKKFMGFAFLGHPINMNEQRILFPNLQG